MLSMMEINRKTYGFFPFNETTGGTNAAKYNFGFGTKLEIKFRLTADGNVTENNNTAPITFGFPEMMMYGYLLMENWHWMLAEPMER